MTMMCKDNEHKEVIVGVGVGGRSARQRSIGGERQGRGGGKEEDE